MRRLASLLAVVAAGLAALLATGAGEESGGVYRVDAIFDNAGFLIPGQDVKIAGARVGEVVEVSLTRDRKARIAMAVEREHGPWRDDADCTIQPQSLIGEKFVQCTPGTPRGKPLRGDPHVLGVRNTHAPIDPDLVFAALRAPIPDRLRIVVAELGGGLAGRAEDLSATIRRANPALQQTRRVLAILDEDRERLRTLAGEAERVVGTLRRDRDAVVSAVERGARVATRVAGRRAELGATLERTPGTLAAARPALERLRALTHDAYPVLGDLREAAPPLSQLARDAGPLAEAARPALDRLGDAAKTGEPILRDAAPLVNDLRTLAREALPTGTMVAELFTSFKDRGVVEGLQDFVFYAAQATARFDRYSHIIPAHLLASECAQYATVTNPECSANFAGGGRRPEQRRASQKRRERRSVGAIAPNERRSAPSARDAAPPEQPEPGKQPEKRRELPALPSLPAVPALPDPTTVPDEAPAAEDLLDYLLGADK